MRHRLLDIRFIITRSLIYGILVSLVSVSLILVTFVSGQFFGGTTLSRNIIAFAVAVLIVFGLDPLKRTLSVATDRIFFKAKINYQYVLRQLTEKLSVELDLDRILADLKQILKDEVKVRDAFVLIHHVSGSEDFYEARITKDEHGNIYRLAGQSELASFLKEHKHASLLESLERKIEDTPENKRQPLIKSKEQFEYLHGAFIAPIFVRGQMNAILVLGPKLSGDSFSNDDLQLIEVLGPQIGSAIQKANLFEEVRQSRAGLQRRVEEATAELKERNISLVTMARITQQITRNLDFNKVMQQIADDIANELGYIGAMLFLIDRTGPRAKVVPQAITMTPLTRRAIKLLPKPVYEYYAYFDEDQGLDAVAMKTGTIQYGHGLEQFISPPVPTIIAKAMSKMVGIKGIVSVPIYSENEIIGVIDIVMAKPTDQLNQGEIDTIKSLADQVGIVARNLRLFRKLDVTNNQLQKANEDLKQLDQAKSEFVSIASHQLRTPMTGIMGYLSMMTSGDFGKIAPEHQKILTDLLNESQRMIRLINQFLNVSKIEAGKFTYTKKPVQIADLIRSEFKEVTKVAADKGLKLELKLPQEPLPTITADGDKLQDVILNLLDNAIKYTDKGTVTVGAERADGLIHCYVKDSGIGIDPKDAPDLFNKFVRGSGTAKIHPDGSGLGLFIAKSVIDAHGGRIWADSAGEGKGSTFQFDLPLAPVMTPPPQSAAAHIIADKTTPRLLPPVLAPGQVAEVDKKRAKASSKR